MDRKADIELIFRTTCSAPETEVVEDLAFSLRSLRYARLFFAVARVARLPERGTSGSVQRGPANPARPGREQRYRDRLGCRRSPGVPLIGKFKLPVVRSWISVVSPRLRYLIRMCFLFRTKN